MDEKLLDKLNVMYYKEAGKIVIAEHINLSRLKEILSLYDEVLKDNL